MHRAVLCTAKSEQCLGAETGGEEGYQTAVVSSMCLCLKLAVHLLSSSSFCSLWLTAMPGIACQQGWHAECFAMEIWL